MVKLIVDKKAWHIIKKYAKTGTIDVFDVIDLMKSAADKHKQAPLMPKQTTMYNNKSKLKRKRFSPTIQELVLKRQAYRCNVCKERLDAINFDHIDGSRSNNSISNCQALCPNCHAKKTRMMNRKYF